MSVKLVEFAARVVDYVLRIEPVVDAEPWGGTVQRVGFPGAVEAEGGSGGGGGKRGR